MGIAILLVGSSWILPMNESTRLDSEIKRRAIIQEGVETMLLDSRIKRRAIAQEDMEKASKEKVTT